LDLLSLDKLQVKFMGNTRTNGPIEDRCYTLTYSDFTGKLFLSIGYKFDKKAISGFYSRLMRDEVLAKWLKEEMSYALHLYCHISGGMIIGRAGWRNSIFRHEMPLVLKCICNGDKGLFNSHTELKNSPIIVHFKSSNRKFDKFEKWGTLKDYIIQI